MSRCENPVPVATDGAHLLLLNPQGREMNARRRVAIAAGTGVLVVVLVLSVALRGRRSADTDFMTAKVVTGTIRQAVSATGTVQPVVTVQVGSQVSGQIQTLYADYNSVVKRGQLLARIDPRNFQAQLDEDRANLVAAEAHARDVAAQLKTQEANQQAAQANLTAAKVTRDNTALILRRDAELIQQQILDRNTYDSAKADADTAAAKVEQATAAVKQAGAQLDTVKADQEQARAQIQQAEAELNKAKVNLDYCDIVSPVDGVVISRSVDVGQTVAASLQTPTLFAIANDLTKMQVNASIDEADVGQISRSGRVSFTVGAYPNETFPGRISEIRLNPQTVQNVVTYSVIIDVDNSQLKLKPGMTANITITVGEQANVLKVPNAALRYRPPGVTPADEMALLGIKPGGRPSRGAPGASAPAATTTLATPPALAAAGRTPARPPGGAPAQPALGPGELWNPADKIQFPDPEPSRGRAAIVWVFGQGGKPESRKVVVGMTDGVDSALISGALKAGDAVIVADSSQGTSGRPATPGFGPRMRF